VLAALGLPALARALTLPEMVSRWLIFDACGFRDTTITVEPQFIKRYDLTGDGTEDIIVSGEGITCQDGNLTHLCRNDGICSGWIFHEGLVDNVMTPLARPTPSYGRELFIIKNPVPRRRAVDLGDRVWLEWRDGDFRVEFE
jgi:hypothetical protein